MIVSFTTYLESIQYISILFKYITSKILLFNYQLISLAIVLDNVTHVYPYTYFINRIHLFLRMQFLIYSVCMCEYKNQKSSSFLNILPFIASVALIRDACCIYRNLFSLFELLQRLHLTKLKHFHGTTLMQFYKLRMREITWLSNYIKLSFLQRLNFVDIL